MHAEDIPSACIACLERLATGKPRVHCITNSVAVNLAANTLLAIGASPSVTYDPSEVEGFTQSSAALAINIGTLDNTRRESIPKAIAAAKEHGIPWVMDPVMATRSQGREAFARVLLQLTPTSVRGNQTEIDSLDITPQPSMIVAKTGVSDLVSDGRRTIRIENGHPLMDRVTAMGCAETALIAAFLAVSDDALVATASAILAFNIAGEQAAEVATGPGSFPSALLDSLYALDRDTVMQRSRVT